MNYPMQRFQEITLGSLKSLADSKVADELLNYGGEAMMKTTDLNYQPGIEFWQSLRRMEVWSNLKNTQ